MQMLTLRFHLSVNVVSAQLTSIVVLNLIVSFRCLDFECHDIVDIVRIRDWNCFEIIVFGGSNL